MKNKNHREFHFIDTNEKLTSMVDICQTKKMVALDTEFIRTDTFFPKPALIQLYDGSDIYLIDPVYISDFSTFKMLLLNEDVIKIMHSASEDIEVFLYLLDCCPKPIIDTQLAASMAGFDFSISYQRLVKDILNKDLIKSETRSDWLRRPLSHDQINYAIDDVIWLLDIYHFLNKKLDSLGRINWLNEDCDYLISKAESPIDLSQYYTRIKSASRLRSKELNSLREICIWREEKARNLDIPRNRVVSDSELLSIISNKINSIDQFYTQKIFCSKKINLYAKEILQTLHKVSFMSEDQYPLPLKTKNSSAKKTLKELKLIVNRIAMANSIPEALLAPKKDLEALIFSSNPYGEKLLQGWRGEIFSSEISDIFQKYKEA